MANEIRGNGDDVSGDSAPPSPSKLADALIKLHRTGGIMLVLIFVGLICMAWAHFRANLSTPLFIVGAIVTVTCLGLYVWKQLRKPLAVLRESRFSAAVEDLAYELTSTVDAFQSLGSKHQEFTKAVFGDLSQKLAHLPGLEMELHKLGISNPRAIPHLITDVSTLSKDAIKQIKDALSEKDPKALAEQAGALARIRRKINQVLSSPQLHEDLLEAVTKQDVTKVRHLVELGAPVDRIESPSSVETPLTAAVRNGNFEIVKLLLAANADPNAYGGQDKTSLILSVEKKRHEILRALIEAKANINLADKSGRTALMWAADTGDLGATQLLIEAHADLQREDFSQLTALARAKKKRHHDVEKALIAAGAKAID
jgi:ankyrin repeat protein